MGDRRKKRREPKNVKSANKSRTVWWEAESVKQRVNSIRIQKRRTKKQRQELGGVSIGL